MRLAIVATPAPLPDMRPAPGALDGDLMRARLPLADTGFAVVDLDPTRDLAEQIELLFERRDVDADAPVLFYVSCNVMQSVEGELFLCLDPSQPNTGDSLAELTMVFRERTQGSVAFVLELRHAPAPDDPFLSATVVGAAKDAVAPLQSGIELLIAARPSSNDMEDRASPLTRALIGALDEADLSAGMTIIRFFSEARESPQLLGAVPCFAHVRGTTPFELVPRAKRSLAPARAEVRAAPVEARATREIEGARGSEETAAIAAEAIAAEPIAATPIAAEPIAATPIAPIAVAPEEAAPAVRAADSEAAIEPPPALQAASGFAIEDAVSVDVPIVEDDEPAPAPHATSNVVTASGFVPSGAARSVEGDSSIARVIIAAPAVEPPPPIAEPEPPPKPASIAPPKPASIAPPPPATAADFIAAGVALLEQRDDEGALAAWKRALGLLGGAASAERADVYVRIGQVKQRQAKRREAISNFEKALQQLPSHAGALEALIDLNVEEADWRAVHGAEERLLATVTDAGERFARLVEFGARWHDVAADATRARATFERARDLRPEDLGVLRRLRALYEAAGAVPEALATRRRIAELTTEPRARAEEYFELGKHCLFERKREELGLELFDLALESDPSMLEPLAVVARVLAERQEWSELEAAYRRMLERAPRIPRREVRSEVTWELCRRLGLLFRDHLEDPALALDAFEDAVAEKPADLNGRIIAADLARSIGKNDRAAVHLQAAAALEPARIATYHDLFEVFQKVRRPDQAYAAACVTMALRKGDSRERFIFEEHRPKGVPQFKRAIGADGWDLLRVSDRDRHVEAVLEAIAPAAIGARLAELADEGRLPALDPAARQDPQKSTVSIVRSFTWAAHFLDVPLPAIYVHEDAQVAIASVTAEEPTAIAGSKVLRGRSLPELAFLVGRHLAYYVGAHRLTLHYPSIEELSGCFLAAVKIALPEVPLPLHVRKIATQIERRIAPRLTDEQRKLVKAAVAAFEAQGRPANLADWVAAVERCATRAGYLLAGDLEVALGVIRGEPRGLVESDAKLADLLVFSVSDEHHALRIDLGVAIEP